MLQQTLHLLVWMLVLGPATTFGADVPHLETLVLDSTMRAVTVWPEGVAIISRPSLEISLWDGSGARTATCTPPGLEGLELLSTAARDGLVLMTFDSGSFATQVPAKGRPGGTATVVVVDVDRCKVVHRFEVEAFPPMVRFVAVQDGWLQVAIPGMGRDPVAVPRDDRGEPGPAVEMPAEFLGDIERRFRRPEAIGVLPVPVGKRDTWFLPVSTYEWWIPGTATRSPRRVQPPECLHEEGRELAGAAAVEAFVARGKTDEDRERLREVADSIQGDGQNFTVLEPSARPGMVASSPERVVVLVRDRTRDGWRLDLWDASSEAVVAVLELPAAWEPRMVALGNAVAWLQVEGGFQQVDLPESAVLPLEHPCDEATWTNADPVPAATKD